MNVRLALEELCGSALMIAHVVWIAVPSHPHTNRANDISMILGAIGAVLVLHGLYRRISHVSDA